MYVVYKFEVLVTDIQKPNASAYERSPRKAHRFVFSFLLTDWKSDGLYNVVYNLWSLEILVDFELTIAD